MVSIQHLYDVSVVTFPTGNTTYILESDSINIIKLKE